MSIVFYISGHGFGHASRQVEVINLLGKTRPDLRIILRSAVNPGLLERTVTARYELRPGACDSGIVQKTSVVQDDEATTSEAIAFNQHLSEWAARERRELADDGVQLIVGDIPPLAFEVAAQLGVPSLAIGNFTWDWIYETHPGLRAAAPWLVPTLRRAYQKASLALELPFAGGFEIFASVRQIPLIARHPTRGREETREHFGLPRHRPVVLLSFGGYGLPSLDLERVDGRGEWTIATTDRLGSSGTRSSTDVVTLPESAFKNSGFRYEDLVAASDVVFTKPGFGIIAECIACQTPMLYTSRGSFREYDVLVAALPRYLRCRFVEQSDLFAGRWRDALSAVLQQPSPPETMATNGAEAAVEAINELVGSAR